jgi:DNA polymerase III epsilon subunit-like protein
MDALVQALSAVALGAPAEPYFIAVDTEGTTRTGGIRELGAVAVEDDALTFFDTVTQRGKGEGLSPKDAARTWAVVGPRFLAWVREVTPAGRQAVLVGHNGACHDFPLLRADSALACPEADWSGLGCADTLAAVRSALPELKKRDLSSAYAHLYGSPPPKHCTHTALADARAVAALAADPRVRDALAKARKPWDVRGKLLGRKKSGHSKVAGC